MKKSWLGGQSIIEYIVILVVVAILALAFTAKFLTSGKLNLFTGYVQSSTEKMR